MVVKLKKLIDTGKLDSARDAISRFTCKDDDVESFLKNKAVDFENRNKSRTYLITDDDGINLLGYFTLSLKALPFSKNVSRNIIKHIDGFSRNIQSVGIILIGQFGKDVVLAKDVDGASLFDLCMQTIRKAQDIVGGRFVLLECRDIEKVKSFYTKQGFIPLQYDYTDSYVQMVKRL